MDFYDVMNELTDLVDRMKKEYDEHSNNVEFYYDELMALKQVIVCLSILYGHEDIV